MQQYSQYTLNTFKSILDLSEAIGSSFEAQINMKSPAQAEIERQARLTLIEKRKALIKELGYGAILEK